MAFDLNKLTPREKKITGILFLILATLPFFYFTLPSWNKYIELNSKINQGKSRLKELDIQIRKLEKLKGENLGLLKKIDNQKLYLAKSYEIDFLVQDLKKICDESSISLDSFTPALVEPVNIVIEKQLEAESQGASYSRERLKQTLEKLKGQNLPVDLYKLPIEVMVTGSFTDVLELFKKLENYGRVISVENISISKVQAKQAFENRLSKSKPKKQKPDTGGLLSSFDLVAYSAAMADETLPFTQLRKSVSSTDKYTFRAKKKR